MVKESDRPQALLTVTDLTKRFGSFTALDSVSLTVDSGEIVAVLGHNGSGKSTLVKVLAGFHSADGGSFELHDDGTQQADLHFIHQNLGLIEEFNAVENLMVTRPTPGKSFVPNRSSLERTDAASQISLFDQEIDLRQPVSKLMPAERAVIAISRALSGWTHTHNVLILDEPTESLHSSEVDTLFSAVRKVADSGAGIIFISHRLEEVLRLAHRIVVLRDGKMVADLPRSQVDHDTLVELIAGGAGVLTESGSTRNSIQPTEAMLAVKGLSANILRGIDVSIRPGEILGVSGVLGSGREEVARALFDTHYGRAKSYRLDGQLVGVGGPKQSIERGIGFVPGDRIRHGSIPDFDATENLTLAKIRTHQSRSGSIQIRREREEALETMKSFDVRPLDVRKLFRTFSGGNQQKIVLLKWLRLQPKVLLLEEPTQGVDIAAKAEIFAAISKAAGEGVSILIASSDAKELARVCHRVIVLNEGEIVGEVLGDEITEANLIKTGHVNVGEANSSRGSSAKGNS